MSEYREVLNTWSEKHMGVPAERIHSVEVNFSEGYPCCEDCVSTPNTVHISINVRDSKKPDKPRWFVGYEMDELAKFGELLTELFNLTQWEN